jgi:hypothetical protein
VRSHLKNISRRSLGLANTFARLHQREWWEYSAYLANGYRLKGTLYRITGRHERMLLRNAGTYLSARCHDTEASQSELSQP